MLNDSKNPGGYQIIDLGDLSKITTNPDTTLKIDGIYEKIHNPKKPIVLTGYGATGGASGLTPSELVRSHWFAMENGLTFGYMVYDANGALSAVYGIEVTTEDKLFDYNYEA